MNNNAYEQEINLKDLLFTVLRKWRPIMLTAFALAILLGGYKGGKELMNQGNEEFVSDLKEQYKNDLDKYEQSKKGYERDIANLTASITYQEKYKENSILLKIDPYNKGTASVDVFVRMLEPSQEMGLTVLTVDYADGVVKAYASAIQQGGFLAGLAEQKGIDLIYLKELIKVTVDYDSNMFNVSITYPDEIGAEEILNEIIDSIESEQSEVQEKLGQHSISLMNQDVGVVTDQSLTDYQQQKVKNLTDTNNSLKEAEEALDELVEPTKPVALSKISILKAGVKYGILGWIAGAFLTAFGISVIFVMNGKLSTDNDLKDRFGLKFLGGFTEKRDKKSFSRIDELLDSLEGKENIPDELVCDMIAVNIHNFILEDKSIFLTGTVEKEVLESLVIKLQKRLPELKLEFGADMTRNVLTLQRIPEYDEIILVETRKESRHKEIEREVETVLNLKKNIVGYIMLDSSKSCVDA
ncbi:hypothetical protein [Lacrimispora indolis]|uniref:hypothetical protein n=1 Tax=Lacrimispora indolis TaxID=69825 RepID=UPI00045EB037|nr:hypothetical protein [Lacrimispora indolis]